jgi:hypothetical protein
MRTAPVLEVILLGLRDPLQHPELASPKAPCGAVHFAASTECWHNRLARQMTAVRQPVGVPSGTGPHRKAVSCICFEMADRDPELEHLLKAERLAFERYDRLRGYPGASFSLMDGSNSEVRSRQAAASTQQKWREESPRPKAFSLESSLPGCERDLDRPLPPVRH